MDKQHQELLMGIILLILIIDTIAIFSVASGISLQASSLQASLSRTVPVVAEDLEPVAPVTSPSPSAAVNTTVNATVNATPSKEKTPVPTPTPTPVPARRGYVNIFSMKDYRLDTSIEPILFNLVNPPLIIDFSVTPLNITDMKYFEYKTGTTEHHESIPITRPYENAAFTINITNLDTGITVAEDGFGEEFGLQSPKIIEVKERGNYTIRAAGKYVNVSLAMEVPKERNMPLT